MLCGEGTERGINPRADRPALALWHSVLVVPLRGSAHHQQAAAVQRVLPSRGGRRCSVRGSGILDRILADLKEPRGTERDAGDRAIR